MIKDPWALIITFELLKIKIPPNLKHHQNLMQSLACYPHFIKMYLKSIQNLLLFCKQPNR